jgi:hypothetical protein
LSLNSREQPAIPLDTIIDGGFESLGISGFFEWSQYVGRSLKMPVSELMHRFPGIHINALCRQVSPDCEAAAIEQRAASPRGLSL